MERAAVPFPVMPGKSEADIRRIAQKFLAEPEAYRESRTRAGVTVERAYWQHTPMGDFVVAYLEADNIARALGAAAQSDLQIDRFFVETVREVHGVDLTQPPPGAPPENIGEWFDPAVRARGRGMAFSAPIIPGTDGLGRAFMDEAFNKRGDEFAASRLALGQSGEVVTLNHTPMGDVVAVYLEASDPFEGNRRFAASTSPFDVWFKEECRKVFPPFVDFNVPVPGITEIFDSTPILAPS